MTAAQYLEFEADVIDLLETSGYIDASGNFVEAKFASIDADVAFAKGVEGVLKAHGVTVPAKVDAVLTLLPAVAALFK